MMKSVSKLSLFATTLLATSIQANSEIYIGAGATAIKYKNDSLDANAHLWGALAVIGNQITENFGLELRGGPGIGDDEIISGVDLSLEYFASAYTRLGVKANNSTYLYTLLGLTELKAEADISGNTASDTENSFSYGFGALIGDTTGLHFSVEYVNYYDKNETNIRGLTSSVRYTF
jgi:hypothetical protein